MKELSSEIFRLLPGCFLVVDARDTCYRIVEATDAYLAVARRGREIIGRPLFDVFPDSVENRNEGVVKLRASFEKVVETKQSDEWDVQRYDTNAGDDQPFEPRFWQPSNIPILGKEGNVEYIIHSVVDVTSETSLLRKLRSKDKRVQQQIADAISTTQEIERMEIGRDLHDNINQLLITSRLYLGKALTKAPVSASLVKGAYELIEKAIEEIRNVSTALSSASQDEENLIASLEDLVAQVVNDGSITVEKAFELPDESLIEAKVKVAIFRIIQEQFTNILKHADAKKIVVRLAFSDNHLRLFISDDGKGFQMNERKQGLGFQNMKTRVAMMDGTITINSSPGDGCTIEVNLPAGSR
ncbi:MAG TPA: ATP-binding protein [Flavisolibacter sp.]